MSWVVNDSEDEADMISLEKSFGPQAKTHSSISDFSPREIIVPTGGMVSTISEFTMDNALEASSTVADSILNASVLDPVPIKPPRPRPRPRYRTTTTESINSSASAASVTANAINKIGTKTLSEAVLDTTFSVDIAEETKSRKRTIRREPTRSFDNFKHPNSIVEGSSKDVIVIVSSDAEHEVDPIQHKVTAKEEKFNNSHSFSKSRRSPALPVRDTSNAVLSISSASASHSIRVPSPLFDQRKSRETSPPSSPFQPQRKRRRPITEDFGFLDDGSDYEIDNGYSTISARKGKEPSVKKPNRSEAKKPRTKKVKQPTEDGAVPAANPTTANARKRQPKAKESAKEQEFKSKEFIEDSEDDLLLVPDSSIVASRISRSDPVNATMSVHASVDASVEPSVFTPTGTAVAYDSVLPSLMTSVRPPATISVPPSADTSAPPPSPSVPQSSRTEKSKPEKRKKKRATPANASSDTGVGPATVGNTDHETTAIPEESGVAIVVPKKKTRKDKQRESVKETEASISRKEDNLPTLDHDGSAEQSIPASGKPKSKEKKDRKKRGTIVSSDEDEPEVASIRDKPVIMEVDNDIDKPSHNRSEDKENQALLSPKGRQGKTPPSLTQAQPSDPKQRVSTPKVPPRRDSMSALIRRASSKVQSPLGTPSPACSHSPLAKISRAALSRIAPLHPNRRTPPPAPPRPPAPKKSKKMLELEEKWEMELAETIEGWSCMADDERASLRRAKKDAELGYED